MPTLRPFVLACAPLMMGTSVFALPAESGRDWDTAANAVRFIDVTTPVAVAESVVDSGFDAPQTIEAEIIVPTAVVAPQVDTDVASSTRLAAAEAPDEVPVVAAPSSADVMAELVENDPQLVLREGEGDDQDTMMMLAEVLFPFGEATIAPAAEESLQTIATTIADLPRIEVMGHTDAIGSEEDNLALAQARAEAVRDWLITSGGLSADVVSAVGVGEGDPVADNITQAGLDNPDGRALNRRVEFAFP